MSCYICNKDTLETVLKTQMMCDDSRATDDEEIIELWNGIVRANYKSVCDRYGGEIPDDLDEIYPVPFTMTEWSLDQDKPNKIERYKALKEYMYQCSEGDYHERPGYYKCQWCLDEMLWEYINKEF